MEPWERLADELLGIDLPRRRLVGARSPVAQGPDGKHPLLGKSISSGRRRARRRRKVAPSGACCGSLWSSLDYASIRLGPPKRSASKFRRVLADEVTAALRSDEPTNNMATAGRDA
jgi:hypothetical protein